MFDFCGTRRKKWKTSEATETNPQTQNISKQTQHFETEQKHFDTHPKYFDAHPKHRNISIRTRNTQKHFDTHPKHPKQAQNKHKITSNNEEQQSITNTLQQPTKVPRRSKKANC